MRNYLQVAIMALLLFLLVNTMYFWEGQLGLWDIPVTLALFFYFIALAGLFIYQVVAAFKEKFTDKARLLSMLIQLAVLVSVCLAPTGLVDFDRLTGKDVLVADREGVANCVTRLKLKANSIFIQRQVCFGITEIKGSYAIKHDTLFFTNVAPNRQVDSFYTYAVLKQEKTYDNKNAKPDLYMYYSKTDTVGYPLFVAENNLKNLHVLP